MSNAVLVVPTELFEQEWREAGYSLENLAMLKTLMLAYRATQQEVYKTEAAQLVKEINTLYTSLLCINSQGLWSERYNSCRRFVGGGHE